MSGVERADWTDLIEAERMLAVGLSGAEIAVFARFSVQTNTLLVKKSGKEDILPKYTRDASDSLHRKGLE